MDRQAGRRLSPARRPDAARGSAAAARRRARGHGRRRRRAAQPAHAPAGAVRAGTDADPKSPIASRRSRRRCLASPAAADRGLELFNGLGGFADDGREYVMRVECGDRASASRALDERRRPRTLRVRLHRVGPRLHLVGEQPRQPAHALAQRSRSAIRRARRVHPRRGQRSVLVRDAAAGRRRASVHGAPRPGLFGLRARPRASSRPSCCCSCRADQPVKVFRLALRNTSPRRRRLSVTLYAEWVLGENRSRTAIHVVTGIEPSDRRRARRATASARSFRNASRSSISRRATSRSVTGRSHRVHRTQRIARPARRARTRRAVEPDGRRRSIRAAPSGSRSICEPIAANRSSSACSATPRTPRRCARSSSATATAGTSTTRSRDVRAVLGRRARNGDRAHARSGDGPAAQSLAALSDAGVPHLGALGVLPVQRRLRLPRSAAGHAGAGRVRAGARRARTCCAPPRVSSSKETSSTGGTSRAARACARDSRTTGCGWCTRRCTTSRATGDDAVLDEQVPFLTGRLLNPDEHEAYEQPSVSSETGSLYEHCVRAIDDQPGDRRPRPAAHGHGRLERRDEPGRRRRQGRERLARLVPRLDPPAVRRRRASGAAMPRARRTIGGTPRTR